MKKVSAGQRVRVLRDIVRVEGPYAQAGELGEVYEMFNEHGRKTCWYAKVRMDHGDVKTFRVTSLERV